MSYTAFGQVAAFANNIKLVKAFVLVFDTSVKNSTFKFKLLSWNWVSPSGQLNQTTKTTFNLAVTPDKRCVVTYRNIRDLNINANPFLAFTSYNTTTSIACEANPCSNTTLTIGAFCWSDVSGCPPSFPYK